MSEDYTQTNNCIEQIKKRHESSFNLDYISDVGFLLSHIHTLEEKVKELREQSNSIAKIASDYSLKIAILEETIKQFKGRIKGLEDAINNTGCLVLKNSIGKSKEVETDLQDYRERNPLVEQLSERIKELETDLKFRDSYEKQPPK